MAAAPGRDPLHIVVRIDRSRLQPVCRPRAASSGCQPADSQSSDQKDDGDDAAPLNIRKKKISASDEVENGDFEVKKMKKKNISTSEPRGSHEKTQKPSSMWKIKLKKARAAPKHSDEKKEEKERIKEALQKRCVVKIEKHAPSAVPLRQPALAAGDAPGEVRCTYCSRTFRTVSGMRVHRTRIHIQKEGKAPWCASCREVFQDVKKLNRHSKRCAGMQKDLPGNVESPTPQRAPADFPAPSPGHARHAVPRDGQPELDSSHRPDRASPLRPPAAGHEYQFLPPAPTRDSPVTEAVAEREKEKWQHTSFGGEEPSVGSPAHSPRRKSLRPRKVVRVEDEPSGESAEWEGAHSSLPQDGERRVQPSRSAKSAVESYCEGSDKSAPEDSQDCETGKSPGDGRGAHGTSGEGNAARHGSPSRDAEWTSFAAGARASVCTSYGKKGQYRTEEGSRGVTAINSRPKKENAESGQTLLVRPSVSPIVDVCGDSVTEDPSNLRVRQTALDARDSVGPKRDTRRVVPKNCLPVTETVGTSTIPGGRRGEPRSYYRRANEQSPSRVSCQNTDSDVSGDEIESLYENLYISDGKQQSLVNSKCEMNSLESKYQNNLTGNTDSNYSCQKPSPLRFEKESTLLDINTDDAPLNLSVQSADEATNNEPFSLNEGLARPAVEVHNSNLSDKSAPFPQNANSPQSSSTRVNVHLHNDSDDVMQSGKNVHENGTSHTEPVQDAAMDLRKSTVPAETEEVPNFVSAITSSNGTSSDSGDGPSKSSLKFCDTTEVETDERPAREGRLETAAKSPSQFSETEDVAALDSVRTLAASADDEASDGSETETCDEPSEVWSPDHRSENGDKDSSTLNSNGPVSSTTSITAIFNDSSTRSEIVDSKNHSPETPNISELEASGRQSSFSVSNTSGIDHNDEDRNIPSPAGVITDGRVHSVRAEQSVHRHTADSTTEDPVSEESKVTYRLSVVRSPRDETSQSQSLATNIVEDVKICGESNSTPKEGKPLKLTENSGGQFSFTAYNLPKDSKEKKETDTDKKPQETTLPCIEIMQKLLDTIPKPPRSPAREPGTLTEHRELDNPGGSSKLAEVATHSQETGSGGCGFFLAPATLSTPRAPTPRTVTVAKDLSEYESSSSCSFAEQIMRTHETDSPPAAAEMEDSSSLKGSRTDLRSEEPGRSSLAGGGGAPSNGDTRNGSSATVPVSGTVGTATNFRTLGTHLTATAGNTKPRVGALTTADEWLAASQGQYGIQKDICNSPSSADGPVSPLALYANRTAAGALSPLVPLECITSPQRDSGGEVKSTWRSPVEPPDYKSSRGMSEATLPPFSTLVESFAEMERPDRPCSLPAGVKMELTANTQTDDETPKLHTTSVLCVSTENTQSGINCKSSSKLAQCSGPKDEEPYILYEHRPKALNLLHQDRPSSAPLAKTNQKDHPHTGRFHLEQRCGTVAIPSAADQCAYQTGNGTPQAHQYSQQPQLVLNSGSSSNFSATNASYNNSIYTLQKGDSPFQSTTPASWPLFEIGQACRQSQTANVSPKNESLVQGTLNNTLSETKHTTFKNTSQADGQDILAVAGGEVSKMSKATREATEQNTTAQVGQSTLPNLPDIIGCKMADSVLGKPADTLCKIQTERHFGGIPALADSQMRGVSSGRRGRGGRRSLPTRDDLRPCECPCGKVCKNSRGLEQHKARAHRDVVFFEGDGGESCCSWPHVLGARSFRCPCGARFARLDAIRKHFVTEQAESGGHRWWISDRVPICVCCQADRTPGALDRKVPLPSFHCVESYSGAGQTARPDSGHVFPQVTWPDMTFRQQTAPGDSKRPRSSALDTGSSPVTDVTESKHLPTGSFGGIPGQYGSDSNLSGLWSPPFPVTRPPSQSAVRAVNPAQTTARHYVRQNSPSEWWSPAANTQNSVAQPSPSVHMLTRMQDCSNFTINPAERYTLGSGEKLHQFTTGGPDVWSHKHGSQSADGSWTLPGAPLEGSGTFGTRQQRDTPSSYGDYDHTGRATRPPDPAVSQNSVAHQERQHGGLDRPRPCRSRGNELGSSRTELQQWNFQNPRSPRLFSTAQPEQRPKLSFGLQEFCSPHQDVAPSHWGAGTLPPPPPMPVASAVGGLPSQSFPRQSEYSGARTGFETTPQPADTLAPGARACYPSGVGTGPAFPTKGEQLVGTAKDDGGSPALVATVKNEPARRLLPISKTRED